ncbi:MAG: hypothetical protein K8U57_00865 [Planctomycetes bacterium]|nr:hypothetical protein [Planctomycetota bacterium]
MSKIQPLPEPKPALLSAAGATSSAAGGFFCCIHPYPSLSPNTQSLPKPKLAELLLSAASFCWRLLLLASAAGFFFCC